MVTRYVGICQICEKTHKLRSRLLVHHGYTVEENHFENDCPGVDFPPYEVSCLRLKDYFEGLKAKLRGLRTKLDRLKKDQIDVLPYKGIRPG